MAYEYRRVIPRDLFNEANLLKCYGQLWLCLEKLNLADVSLDRDVDGDPFEVWQDEDSGATCILNIYLYVRGEVIALHRPLNSREPFPLYATTGEGDEVAVFAADGTLSADMLALLKG